MSETKPIINYFSRDYNQLRNDLINYVKNYHKDKFQYFNAASPDMMYLELLAYVGDTLNYSLDKSFNEAFRGTAQARESLIRIANDFGFYNYYAKPASTQITLSIKVPAIPNNNGTAMIPDSQYLFVIRPGMTVQAKNGSIFECIEEVNFSQELNRKIIPNYDSNGVLLDFTVKKTVPVIAGETKIQRFYITQSNSKPYLEIILDDLEVTEILGVVAVKGNSFTVPSDVEFRADAENSYVEVENLAQDKIFVELNPTENLAQDLLNAYTDMTINYGEWINKPKRFIVRRDKNNVTSLIFGSTLVDYDNWNKAIGSSTSDLVTNFSLTQILNNLALGQVPEIDTTLFIKYRSGAGVRTNVLGNAIDSIIQKQIVLSNTPNSLTVLEQVRSSLTIESNLPAIGGSNAMANEDIRNSIGKVFAANDRGVTYEDIKALIGKMPAKFGTPFRISYEEIKPKLLNYTQIKNFVEAKLDEILLAGSYSEKDSKIQEVKRYLADYPTQVTDESIFGTQTQLNEISNGLTNGAKENLLWFGQKCRLYVLGINEDLQPTTLYKDSGNIMRSPNEALKLNIKNFLKEKRVIGDWLDIVDARVVNIQVEFTIIADKKNKQKVLIDCLTKLRDYFNVYNWNINQPIFKANVVTILQELEGVINVVDLKFYNIFNKDLETGKDYSPEEYGRYKHLKSIPMNSQGNKFEILDFSNVIISDPSTFLHVKYPDIDIKGKVL